MGYHDLFSTTNSLCSKWEGTYVSSAKTLTSLGEFQTQRTGKARQTYQEWAQRERSGVRNRKPRSSEIWSRNRGFCNKTSQREGKWGQKPGDGALSCEEEPACGMGFSRGEVTMVPGRRERSPEARCAGYIKVPPSLSHSEQPSYSAAQWTK